MRRLLPTIAALLATLVALALAGCTGGSAEQPAASPSASAAPPPPPPPPEGAVTAQFFGMHDHEPVGASWPKAPVGSLRVWDAGVLWRDVEKAPGQFDFSRLDAIVTTAEKHHADVLVVLGQTPPFHALRPNAAGFYGAGAASPPTLDSWTAYVRALAERYAGRPVSYQVWNEANVKGFWRGTPAEMAQLTKAARDVLDAVAPKALLVAPAFVLRLIGQRAWYDSFWGERVGGTNVADLVDAVSLQLYPPADGTPVTALQLLAYARTVLDRHRVHKPIWNTEVNFGLSGLEVPPADETTQAANVAQSLLLNAANGIQRVYWYGWDQRSIVNTLLTQDDGSTPTPAGDAYRRTQEWLLDSAVDGCTQDGPSWTCTLRRADGVRRVYWSDAPFALLPLPAGAMTVQTLDGPAHLAVSGSMVPLGPEPVMVDSRS